MAVKPGARLGPYEVLSLLGAGGMGEVYRARDSRLARDVAIKVLPEDSTTNPERLRRFEREARAVGALNHPNLLAIFDTGQYEGEPFVVFELLEGETLRVRLDGKALAPQKAIDYAIQIARGLAAAHEKGIVHRDLKPENLFLTRDDRIKILDFGLAKLRPALDPGGVGVEARTESLDSDAGKVLGTVEYMSPEQVRLWAVDHRSDIFSLGSVLYEMLAGKRAFRGESKAETMAAIVSVEPPALAEANGKVPPRLERIVRHCLEKRRESRFQSALDLVFDLESVAAPSDSSSEVTLARPPRRRVVSMLAAVALAGASVLVGVLWKGRAAPEPLVLKQATFRRQIVGEARFAPDGQTIVYGAAAEGRHNRIYSARLGSPEVREMELPEGDIAAMSASGEIAVLRGRFYQHGGPVTLARAALAGGAPRDLLEQVIAADWSSDGRSLAVVRREGHSDRLEFPIGTVLYESAAGTLGHPRISPKGDRIAFIEGSSRVRVVDLHGKVTTLGTETTWGVAWPPKADEVWSSEWGLVRAYGLDGSRRIVARFPGAVTINDVASDGRVLITLAQWYHPLLFRGPAGTRERDLAWFETSSLAALSQDGTAVLFYDRGPGTNSPFPAYTYLRRTDGSAAVRLGEGFALSLSPDGKWAISRLPDPARCLLLPTGPGEPRVLPTGDLECSWASWFPDGKRLAVVGHEVGQANRLVVQDLDGRRRRPLSAGSDGVNVAEVSPDGKLIVGWGPEGSLMLFPVEGGNPRPVPGARPREYPAGWAADSQSLYVYWTEGDLPTKVETIDVQNGRRHLFKDVTPPDTAAFGGIFSLRVAPSGKAYAYSVGQYFCNLYVVEGMR